jgi:uncharacterized DUF497 family protein
LEEAHRLGAVADQHVLSFDLARTFFNDPRLLSIADQEHSDAEERWFSIGCASNGMMLSAVYVWLEGYAATTRIRMISARKATQNEIREHQESL